MKKVILAAAVLVCAASMVFAAGGKARSGSIPIVKWYGVAGTGSAVTADMKAVVSKYAEDKIGIGLEFAEVPEGAKQAMIQSGEPVDLWSMDGGAADFIAWSEMGAFWEFSKEIQTVAPALWKSMPEMVWSGGRYKGGLYGIPTYKDTAVQAFWIWEKTLIDKYNLSEAIKDTSPAGLDKVFRALKTGEGARFYPATIARDNPMQVHRIMDELGLGCKVVGVRLDDTNRKVVNRLLTPDMLQLFELARGWHVDGIFAPDQNTNPNAVKPIVIMEGSGWPSAVPIWREWGPFQEAVAVPLNIGSWYYTDSVRGVLNSIGINSRYKNESLKMMELICTDPIFRDMLGFGVEGKHFTYIQRPSGQRGGIVQTIPDMKWDGPAQYLSGAWFVDTPQGTVPLLSVTQADVNKASEIATQNARAKSSVLMGFTMDIMPVINERNAVNAVWEKYSADMLGGIYPDWRKRLDDIIAEMNAVGLQKVIDEAQRQIDAWARTQR